jgi:hypothetical protein
MNVSHCRTRKESGPRKGQKFGRAGRLRCKTCRKRKRNVLPPLSKTNCSVFSIFQSCHVNTANPTVFHVDPKIRFSVLKLRQHCPLPHMVQQQLKPLQQSPFPSLIVEYFASPRNRYIPRKTRDYSYVEKLTQRYVLRSDLHRCASIISKCQGFWDPRK